ncbi:MAG: hypothetical protein Q9216_004990 [Gyalolechia sp. 2 TL-2023]
MPGLKRKSMASDPGSSSKSAKKQKQSPPPTKPFLSTEFVVDSSDDETVQQSTKASNLASKAGKTQVPSVAGRNPHPPTKQKHQSPSPSPTASESSAVEESDTSEGSETGSTSETDRPSPRIRNTTEEESESAMDGKGSDEEGSETEESVEERETVESSSIATSHKPPPPYKPPAGFQIASIRSSAKMRDLFSEENLRGKQIWHITAPKNVPVTSIKETPIAKVATGESILSYKGADYGLLQETGVDTKGTALLIPSPEAAGYQLAGAAVTQTLHLQEIVGLPALSDKPEGAMNGAPRASKSHVKAVRQQPPGLRMRYRPFGDNSSSDESDRAPGFKMPPIIPPTKSSTKPRQIDDGVHASPSKDGVKHKKKSGTTRADEDARDIPKSSTKPTSKKRKSSVLDDAVVNDTPPDKHHHSEATEREAQPRARKKHRKERRSSGTTNNWEAEEAHRILAASRKPDKGNATTGTKSDDMALEGKRPEVMKTKRKKRKSEATEEV